MDNMEVATINNRVLLFGNSFLCCLNVKCISSGGNSQKKLKDILEFNLQTESWTVIGAMKEPRVAHSASVVSFEDYKKWCNWINYVKSDRTNEYLAQMCISEHSLLEQVF